MGVNTAWATVSTVPSLDINTLVSMGNGTLAARWRRGASGELLFAVQFRYGTTTNLGSGAAEIRLLAGSFPAALNTWAATQTSLGSNPSYMFVGAVPCVAYDNSTELHYDGSAALLLTWDGETKVGAASLLIRPVFANARMTNAVPFTWADGDVLMLGNALEAFGN